MKKIFITIFFVLFAANIYAEQTPLVEMEDWGTTRTKIINNDADLDERVIINEAKRTYPQTDEDKLATIESGATSDQTGAEIKAAYELEADTNPYTDAEKTKLESIDPGAIAYDPSNAGDVIATSLSVNSVDGSNGLTNVGDNTSIDNVGERAIVPLNGVWQVVEGGVSTPLLGSGGIAIDDSATSGSDITWSIDKIKSYFDSVFNAIGDIILPIIVASEDGTHDGISTIVGGITLTEENPGTITFISPDTNPSSGSLTGTYPNYVTPAMTPTGTSNILVTYAATDLAGNAATGTDLVQGFTYAAASACSTGTDTLRWDGTGTTFYTACTGTSEIVGTNSVDLRAADPVGGTDVLLFDSLTDNLAFVNTTGIINSSVGTLSFSVRPVDLAAIATVFEFRTDNNNKFIITVPVAGRVVATHRVGAVSVMAQSSAGALVADTWADVVVSWDAARADSDQMYVTVNGTTAQSGGSLGTLSTEPTVIYVGANDELSQGNIYVKNISMSNLYTAP